MDEKPPIKVNEALKYSGVGFQIVGIAVAGFFIGYKIDGWIKNEKPYFTIVFSILFTFLGLYIGLKDFIKPTPKR